MCVWNIKWPNAINPIILFTRCCNPPPVPQKSFFFHPLANYNNAKPICWLAQQLYACHEINTTPFCIVAFLIWIPWLDSISCVLITFYYLHQLKGISIRDIENNWNRQLPYTGLLSRNGSLFFMPLSLPFFSFETDLAGDFSCFNHPCWWSFYERILSGFQEKKKENDTFGFCDFTRVFFLSLSPL